MFALILSICMAPINASGQEIGPEICEESHIAVHKTLKQCIMNMDNKFQPQSVVFWLRLTGLILVKRKVIKMFMIIDLILQILT